MRCRNSCGRMSPTRWAAPLVWPLTWQSKQVTPRCGRSERRSSVWLNCCCGKGVTSRRRPSSLLGVQDAVEQLEEVLDRDQLALRDVAEVRPRGQEDGRRELGQEVLGDVEVEVEARQVALLLPLDLVDVELREDHPAFGVVGVGQRLEPVGEGARRPGWPRAPWPRAGPRSCLPSGARGRRPAAPCRGSSSLRGRPVRQVVARGQQVHLFGGYNGISFLQDTWTWNGSTWTEHAPDTSPRGRRSAGLAYDRARKEILLFGGWDGFEFFADTWTWDGSAWTEDDAMTPSPSGRRDVGMADASRKEVLLSAATTESIISGTPGRGTAAPG